ncbi:MAG: hypothetical protein EOO65_02915 [Methanosarcinales archaeon]|nr:MAG: hypothetical protein EOO65_02915 [Methanosarcinales archaeon]
MPALVGSPLGLRVTLLAVLTDALGLVAGSVKAPDGDAVEMPPLEVPDAPAVLVGDGNSVLVDKLVEEATLGVGITLLMRAKDMDDVPVCECVGVVESVLDGVPAGVLNDERVGVLDGVPLAEQVIVAVGVPAAMLAAMDGVPSGEIDAVKDALGEGEADGMLLDVRDEVGDADREGDFEGEFVHV